MQTYAELKQALVDWPDLAGEQDIESYADTLITLGEARVNRVLRLQGMIVQFSQSGTGIEIYDLPSDYLEMDRVQGADGESLESRPADELFRYGYTGSDNCPVYAIDGRRLLFSVPIDAFTIRYYALLPPISQTAHWLFLKEPGLYLYASLIEAATFHKEAEQENARYQAAFQEIVQSLQAEDDASLYPRSQPLRAIVGAGRKRYYAGE